MSGVVADPQSHFAIVAGLRSSRLPCCCLRVTIVIAIVGLHCVAFRLLLLLLLWSSGCTWREGCHGDKDVDIVVDDKVLLGETNKDNELDCSSCN